MSNIFVKYNMIQFINEQIHSTENSSICVDLISSTDPNVIDLIYVGQPFLSVNVRYHCPIYGIFKVSNTLHTCFKRRISGADPGFQVRGAHLKKLRRAQGGANIFGIFRVKNHDFTQKNHIFSNCGGRRENFWGISCEKSRFYAKKSYIFQFFGGGARAGCAPPWIRP